MARNNGNQTPTHRRRLAIPIAWAFDLALLLIKGRFFSAKDDDTDYESDGFLDEYGNIKDSDNDDDEPEKKEKKDKSQKEKQSVEEQELPEPEVAPDQRQWIDLSEPRQSNLTHKEQMLVKELMIKCSNFAGAQNLAENDRDFHSLKQVSTWNSFFIPNHAEC